MQEGISPTPAPSCLPTPICSCPTPLPSVIQDTVWDKQLAQKVPDVSVGPILGGGKESQNLPSPTPISSPLGMCPSRALLRPQPLREGLLSTLGYIFLCVGQAVQKRRPSPCPFSIPNPPMTWAKLQAEGNVSKPELPGRTF